jgi:hypothetical protein
LKRAAAVSTLIAVIKHMVSHTTDFAYAQWSELITLEVAPLPLGRDRMLDHCSQFHVTSLMVSLLSAIESGLLPANPDNPCAVAAQFPPTFFFGPSW